MAGEPERFEMAVLRAARAVRHAFNARLRGLGLTVTGATLLSFLDERGPMTQRELADLLQVSAASVGTVVDGLADRGLVERRAEPTDRRIWRIVPTSSAAPFVAGFRRIDEDVQRDLRNGLERNDRQQLVRLLRVLEHNAVAAARGPVEAGAADQEGSATRPLPAPR